MFMWRTLTQNIPIFAVTGYSTYPSKFPAYCHSLAWVTNVKLTRHPSSHGHAGAMILGDS